MKSYLVTLENGEKAIVFGKLQPICSVHECNEPSANICDAKTGRLKTCSVALCKKHAHVVGMNKKYCPEHFMEYEQQGDLFKNSFPKKLAIS